MKKNLSDLRHARSAKDFPGIDLEKDEYVELAIRRSRIGLFLIWSAEVLGFLALTIVFILLASTDIPGLNSSAEPYLFLMIFALYALLIISGLVGTFIYKDNILLITNQRAIHKERTNLFANSTSVINLKSIEDVSFSQSGIFDYLFHLGKIRMSTVGDETTYSFPFVDTPRDELKIIASLLHKAKKSSTK